MKKLARFWAIRACVLHKHSCFVVALLAALTCGCEMTPPVVGLKPIYPAALFGPDAWGQGSLLKYVKVDSLQPTMKWEAFPRPMDLEAQQHMPGPIECVTYDLRIWRAKHHAPLDLVYTRDGLAEPVHALEESLLPQTRYCWTVRARFEAGGQTRVTPWSFSKLPNLPAEPGPYSRDYRIDPLNFYRFETPNDSDDFAAEAEARKRAE